MRQIESDQAPPRVLISIVNWNGSQHTLNCLQALNMALAADAHLYRARVIVIDNHSQDHSVTRIREHWPALEIIEAQRNLGYAGGHALSLPIAHEWQADVICLLNNDAMVEREALRELVMAWQTNGDAIFAGLEYFRAADGRRILHFPARFLQPPYPIHTLLRMRQHWQQLPMTDADAAALPVGAVLGGLLLLPLPVIEQLEWLKDKWFMYGEELDYAFAYRSQGGRCFLVPTALLQHQGQGSTAKDPALCDLMFYYRTRNEIALAQDYASRPMQLAVILKKCLRALVLMPLQFRRARWMFLGVRDALLRRMGKTWAPECFRSRPLDE